MIYHRRFMLRQSVPFQFVPPHSFIWKKMFLDTINWSQKNKNFILVWCSSMKTLEFKYHGNVNINFVKKTLFLHTLIKIWIYHFTKDTVNYDIIVCLAWLRDEISQTIPHCLLCSTIMSYITLVLALICKKGLKIHGKIHMFTYDKIH